MTFISLEGVDGSGKSHLAEQLQVDVTRNNGIENVDVLVKDQYSTANSTWQLSRLAALHRLVWSYDNAEPVWTYSRMYWLNAVASWYSLFFDCEISPRLAENRTIVVDGWFYKNWARINASDDSAAKTVAEALYRNLPQPSVCLFLSVDENVLRQRKLASSKPSERGAFDNPATIGNPDSVISYQLRSQEFLIELLGESTDLRFLSSEDPLATARREIRKTHDYK